MNTYGWLADDSERQNVAHQLLQLIESRGDRFIVRWTAEDSGSVNTVQDRFGRVYHGSFYQMPVGSVCPLFDASHRQYGQLQTVYGRILGRVTKQEVRDLVPPSKHLRIDAPYWYEVLID